MGSRNMSQKVESHKTQCVAFINFSEDSYYKEKSSREKNKKKTKISTISQ